MPALALSAAALFTLCGAAHRQTCVVDGDTFWLAGEKVRMAISMHRKPPRPNARANASAGKRPSCGCSHCSTLARSNWWTMPAAVTAMAGVWPW